MAENTHENFAVVMFTIVTYGKNSGKNRSNEMTVCCQHAGAELGMRRKDSHFVDLKTSEKKTCLHFFIKILFKEVILL